MSIFDSKRTKWCKSMSTHVDARGEYNQLTASIGPKGAMAFLGIVHDHYEKNKNLASMKADLVSIYTLFERENVAAKRQYLGELVTKTSSGELGTLLANNLRPEVEYYKTPGVARGATPREVAIDKAANWVCGDYVAGIASVKDILASHVPVRGGDHGKLGAALGPTPAGISKVHKKVVPGAPAYRFGYAGGRVRYPTTAGAGVLLDELFNLTAGTSVWPAFGDAHWDSIAMFYLSSLVTIQAFSDGNKRAGHMAYAIVLIKGTHAFKAPTGAIENTLFKMKG